MSHTGRLRFPMQFCTPDLNATTGCISRHSWNYPTLTLLCRLSFLQRLHSSVMSLQKKERFPKGRAHPSASNSAHCSLQCPLTRTDPNLCRHMDEQGWESDFGSSNPEQTGELAQMSFMMCVNEQLHKHLHRYEEGQDCFALLPDFPWEMGEVRSRIFLLFDSSSLLLLRRAMKGRSRKVQPAFCWLSSVVYRQ